MLSICGEAWSAFLERVYQMFMTLSLSTTSCLFEKNVSTERNGAFMNFLTGILSVFFSLTKMENGLLRKLF